MNTNLSAGVRNVVLVHGGFVDGSGWERVYGLHKADGYKVSIVQHATTSLADDVAATRRVLAEQDGPTILGGRGDAPGVEGTSRSWYIVSTDDRMIPPPAQKAMSKRAGSTVVEVKASHAVYESQPSAVASTIAQASRGAR